MDARGRSGPQWIPTPVISTEQTLLDVCGRVTVELGVRRPQVRILQGAPIFAGVSCSCLAASTKSVADFVATPTLFGAFEAPVSRPRVFLFSPDVLLRSQNREGFRYIYIPDRITSPPFFGFGLTLPDVMTNDTHRRSARDAAASVGFGRSDRSGGLGPATVEYAR